MSTKAGEKHRTQVSEGCWRWYYGVLFYLIVQGISVGLASLVRVSGISRSAVKQTRLLWGDPAYFRSLKQAKIAPPAWAFGPAWTINNICVIWGMLRVLNKSQSTEGRDAYLRLQAASWLNYVIFNAAYFGLHSPLNAFAITLNMLVLTILSGFVALFHLRDSLVALSLATLFLWLLLALSGAICQALWNVDEFYQVGPLTSPPAHWVKLLERERNRE